MHIVFDAKDVDVIGAVTAAGKDIRRGFPYSDVFMIAFFAQHVQKLDGAKHRTRIQNHGLPGF